MTSPAAAVARQSSTVKHQSARLLPLAALALVLLAGAFGISAAMRAPAPWRLPFGVAGDERYSSGFYNAEQSAGAAFRWSSPGARLLLHGADAGPIALALRLNGDQLARAGDPTLRLVPDSATSVPTTTFAVGPGWRVYRALLPPLDTASPGLTLVSATARPGPGDGRDLGVALGGIGVQPLPASGSLLPHPRALALIWGVGLGALALLLVGRNRPRFALALAAIAIVGAAIACAGLAEWAYRGPASLALALPPTPWALGLATLALATIALAPTVQSSAVLVPMRLRLWGGAALLVAGQALLNAQTLVWLGVALALMGVGALATLMANDAHITLDARPKHSPTDRFIHTPHVGRTLRPYVALGCIFLIAFALRFWDLGGLPFGLWRDEARHGMVALRILEDPNYRPVYVAGGGVNMPALIFYPFALAIKLFGVHPWTMRPVTALAGALTVLPLYALARRLFNERVGLLAALLLAASAWHITISRFSFPTVFDPLFGLTGLWMLVAALQSWRLEIRDWRQWRPLLLLFGAGVFFGLAVQTYHTGRVVPLVGAVLGFLLIVERWRSNRQENLQNSKTPISNLQSPKLQNSKSPISNLQSPISNLAALLLALALGFLIVAGPYIAYALTQQGNFNDRVSGVFLLSPEALKGRAPLAALDETLGRHLLMFNVRGDENGRHAPPGAPALDFVTGLFLLVGCGLALVAFATQRDWRGPFLLIALALGLLPSALAVDAPHGMRAFGALAFACVLAAWGGEWLVERMRDEGRRMKTAADMQRTRRATLQRFILHPSSFILLVVLTLNAYTYFGWMRTSTDVWMSFYPVHTQMGAYVHDLHARGDDARRQIFVPEGVVANPVFAYLTEGITLQTYSGGVLSEPLRPGALFLLSGYVYERDKAVLAPYIGASPAPVVSGAPFPGRATPSFVGYDATGPAGAARRTEGTP